MIDTTPQIATPEPFYVMQDRVILHAPYQQTGADFFVMQVDVAPGGGPPPLHTHPSQEFFWTLSGRLSYFRDDGEAGLTEITSGPGTSALIPGGVAHTYRNFSDEPASYLAVLSPGREMQDFLVEAGVPAGEPLLSPDEVLGIGAGFGLVTLDIVPEPGG